MKIFFLGGVFANSQYGDIVRSSRGVVQNAADALQKKLLVGFDELVSKGVTIVNLPFVGSYPKRYSKAYLEARDEIFGNRSRIEGVGFLNLAGFKFVFRFFGALTALWLRIPKDEKSVLFVYSAHLPFMSAAIITRILRPNLKICLILPDLPEFMGGEGAVYQLLKRFDAFLFYRLAHQFDNFVVLTRHMITRLGVSPEKSVVVEGVASLDLSLESGLETSRTSGIRSILYTGTLAKRYGILELLTAFSLLPDSDIELWICGEGDGKDLVVSAADRDSRIRYLGQVERNEAMRLQRQATILINPRRPEGEFTKYSFPSKVMEYMATGKPVVMYDLEGIPDEYREYYFCPKNDSAASLADCIKSVLSIPDVDLERFGLRAKDFVLGSKGSVHQARKILNLIFMENEVC